MKMQVDTGIMLAYDDRGEGLPIVFIHGFPHHRGLWSDQVGALGNAARCLAPDIRGFGESDAAPPYSMQQYADDIAALIRTLGIHRAVVAGLSMGGYIAFAMLRQHRELVRALVLADTRAGADDEQGKQKRDDMIALARARGVGAVADAQIEGMLGKSTRERSPELVQRVHTMLAGAPLEGVVGALEAMRDRADSTDLLGTIDVPTLILVGDEDVLTPPKEATKLYEGIRGSKLEVIPGAGHLSNVEQPDRFTHVVGDFLRSVKAP